MRNPSLKSFFLLTALASASISAQAFAENDMTYQGVMKSIPYARVEFQQGSSILSDSDRGKLHDLVTTAAANGTIASINVAVWSDKTFPRVGKLTDADRDLASARAETVRAFLKNEIKPAEINTYSMAEGSNWLARLFKTDDAQLKSVFSKKGGTAPVTHAEYQVIKNEGGPSRAVIVIER